MEWKVEYRHIGKPKTWSNGVEYFQKKYLYFHAVAFSQDIQEGDLEIDQKIEVKMQVHKVEHALTENISHNRIFILTLKNLGF